MVHTGKEELRSLGNWRLLKWDNIDYNYLYIYLPNIIIIKQKLNPNNSILE